MRSVLKDLQAFMMDKTVFAVFSQHHQTQKIMEPHITAQNDTRGHNPLPEEKPVSQEAIQRAKFANAFDILNDHYGFNLSEYRRNKFEIGHDFAKQIHPLAAQSKRFWEYWTFLWEMDSVWIASNIADVGHIDFYDLKQTMLKSEPYRTNATNYINLIHESHAK